jgi:hypothetical protein
MSAHRIIEAVNVFANGFDCILIPASDNADSFVTSGWLDFVIQPPKLEDLNGTSSSIAI